MGLGRLVHIGQMDLNGHIGEMGQMDQIGQKDKKCWIDLVSHDVFLIRDSSLMIINFVGMNS